MFRRYGTKFKKRISIDIICNYDSFSIQKLLMQIFVEQVQNSASTFEEITRIKSEICKTGGTQSSYYLPVLENHKNKNSIIKNQKEENFCFLCSLWALLYPVHGHIYKTIDNISLTQLIGHPGFNLEG